MMDDSTDVRLERSDLKRLRKKRVYTPISSNNNNTSSNSTMYYDLTLVLIGVFVLLQAIGLYETIIHFPTANNTHIIFHRSDTTSDVHAFHSRENQGRIQIQLEVVEENAKEMNKYDGIEEEEMYEGGEEKEHRERFVDEKDPEESSRDEEEDEKKSQGLAEEMEGDNAVEELDLIPIGNRMNHEEIINQQALGDKTSTAFSIQRNIPIPKAIWPVSIRDEDGTFEDLKHPGDATVTMALPRFWSPPVHGNTIMSHEMAMKIGTCTNPDNKLNFQRGDSCPLDQRTIFVAIASYRDWQCRYTVESIFQRAKYPRRVRVTVVDQIVDGDFNCVDPIVSCTQDPNQGLCQYRNQVDVYRVDAPLAVGPVFARHIGHRLYRGEYYAMQVDAHVSFTQNWDVDIIEQLESTRNEMAVLSTYLTDVVGSINEITGESLVQTRPIMCNTDYEDDGQGMHLRHLSQPESYPSIQGAPQLQPYWAAGFSFSRGHFVVNVPYDWYLPMIFQGEEIAIAVRAFTIGYDFYAPERSVSFHHYANGKNKAKRDTVNHFWENSNRYQGKGKLAMKRLLGILNMNPEVDRNTWDHTEEERYGIGHVRDLSKFYSTFGIDVHQKKVVRSLCDFVEPGTMHQMFTQMLREDRMGIDYSKINYKLQ